MKSFVYEDSPFEDDPDGLLSLFFGDQDLDELKSIKKWIERVSAKRRTAKYVYNEAKLTVFPEASQVLISGRWDSDWGEKRMSVDQALALCEQLIRRDRPPDGIWSSHG